MLQFRNLYKKIRYNHKSDNIANINNAVFLCFIDFNNEPQHLWCVFFVYLGLLLMSFISTFTLSTHSIMSKTHTLLLLNIYISRIFNNISIPAQLVNNKTIAVGSSTYKNYVASRAVDGNTDQNVTSCSHTHNLGSITEAWLRIDLGTVYSVKSVKFWYRGDSKYQ